MAVGFFITLKMSFFDFYLVEAEKAAPGISPALKKSAEEFSKKHIKTFNYNEHKAGLLFGHVQSGKTSQMFGLASKAADLSFKFFILITADNIILQKQTLKRAQSQLKGFKVFDETDDRDFFQAKPDQPIIVVLKKNKKVLSTWRNHIMNSVFSEEPLFIMDDEADAASLNTKVNNLGDERSTINSLLEEIRNQAPSSIYLHVTATPQALLLQTADSGWRPSFAHYFPPGKSYLGGNFFYGNASSVRRATPDNEKERLLEGPPIPSGLRKAIMSFLAVGAHCSLSGSKKACSMLLHPSIKILDHDAAKRKTKAFLNSIKHDLKKGAEMLEYALEDAWSDLKETKQDMKDFAKIKNCIEKKVLPNVCVETLNSNTPDGTDYSKGFNILIGGNVLGRGVTFPGLHIAYYCRSTKTPQADTCWQHSRIFGYDRDPDLCRVFSPPSLLKLFKELNNANNALFDALEEKGPQDIRIMTPAKTRPTRRNVVKQDEMMLVTGGVNYFPFLPAGKNTPELDKLLGSRNIETDITIKEARKYLELAEVEEGDTWNLHSFPDCVSSLEKAGSAEKCRLIVRTGRSIAKDTGTLLSPDDRKLGENYPKRLVLTMYRLRGEIEKGWQGSPLWIPNIKFPEGACFYYQPS